MSNTGISWLIPDPYPDLPDRVKKAYTEYLVAHIRCVQEAGRRLGVAEAQLQIHDASKWTPEEFPAYARKFFEDGSPQESEQIAEDFAYAWLHHIHTGFHHWNYWLFADGFSPKGTTVEHGAVYIPHNYMLEMVADWMGVSFVLSGSWDISDWLSKNIQNIRLHSRTNRELRTVLRGLGYTDMIKDLKFAGELDFPS